MKKNIEKSLKRYLKRKVKITLSLITIFLITGSIGYGADLDGTSTGGIVELNNGSSYDNIYGIKDEKNKDASADGGKVTIIIGIGKNIYGGFAGSDDNNPTSVNASNNNITISDISNVELESIFGAKASAGLNGNTGSACVEGNSVVIKNSNNITVLENKKDYDAEGIIGGYVRRGGASSKDSKANENCVEIEKSNIVSDIFGSLLDTQSVGASDANYPDNKKDAVIESKNNKVTITNNSQIGTSDNKKAIYGSCITPPFGGNTATSIENIVSLSNSTMYGDIYGGYVNSLQNKTGNENSSGTDTVSLGQSNQVNINSGKVYGDIVGAFLRDDSNMMNLVDKNFTEQKIIKVSAITNKVIVENNSHIEGNIYGAYNYTRGVGSTWPASRDVDKVTNIEMTENEVVIDTSSIGTKDNKNKIVGAYGESIGSGKHKEAGDISLNNNSVTIKGDSIIFADISGAYGISTGGRENRDTGGSGNVTAIGNKVTIEGGTINGDIYGAYIETEVVEVDGKVGELGTLEAKDNIVTIKGGDLVNSNLYGSNLANSETSRSNLTNSKTSGNNLVIDNWSGKVNSINNFNGVEFQNINWNNGGIVLEITNGENNLVNTKVDLISLNGGSKVNSGDSMYFVKSESNLGTDKNKVSADKDFTLGLGLEGRGELIVEENGSILYKIGNVETSEQVNLLAENRAVSLAFINQGGDLIKQALNTMEINPNYGFKSFFATEGNRSKYDVDSDIKINGWSIVAGLGKTDKLFDRDLDWAIFYESGIGNYRTYNNFNQEMFNGTGELEYRGGGIAGRYYYNDDLSIESSIRVGNLSTEMKNALMDSNKNMYDFDFDTLYYSLHLGVNKNIKVSEKKNLDIYSKYSYTYTDDDNVWLDKQNFRFDSAKSSKIDLGFRVNENKYNNVNLYYGLAFEYEFDGKAHMSIDDYLAPTQSLKGDTYVAELGIKYQTEDSPWSYDVNIHGYAGEREGITGTLNVTYSF